MNKIHGELRTGAEGEPEVWVNLGDVLTWLNGLAGFTDHQVAVAVAAEIRQMLFDAVSSAEVVPTT
jgi:hypothetical protein